MGVLEEFFRKTTLLTKAISETVASSVADSDGQVWYVAEPFARTVGNMLPKELGPRPDNKSRFIGYRSISERYRVAPMQAKGDQSTRQNQVDRDLKGNERIYPIINHTEPQLAEYVIQRHDADVAGPHWDFQINADGYGHRWVIKKMIFPRLGSEKHQIMAVQQPTHAPEHIWFSGVIKEGYGKGTVKIVDRGKMEVLYMNDDRVDFVIYEGPYTGRYKMMRTYSKDDKINIDGRGERTNNWLMTEKRDYPLKDAPPYMDRPTSDYKDVKQAFDTKDFVITKKEDGTHSVIHVDQDRYHGRTVIASRRPPKATNKSYKARYGILHQEDNIPWVRDMPIRAVVRFARVDITNLVELLKIDHERIHFLDSAIKKSGAFGLLFEVEDFNGSIFHVEVVHDMGYSFTSGLMNSNPLRARELQEQYGPVRIVLLDVRQYQGRDVRNIPYKDKWKLMEDFSKHHPGIEVPDRVGESESHEEVHRRWIEQGFEGSVAIPKEARYHDQRYKVKGPMDADFSREYWITGFYDPKPGTRLEGVGVGAIWYSDQKGGEPLGKVGTGISDADRVDMHINPDHYIDKRIVIESGHPIENGKAVRGPSVKEIKRGPEPDIMR